MTAPGTSPTPDGFRPIPWLYGQDWLQLATHPRKFLRAVRHAPVAVRFDADVGPPSVTRWTYDRDRYGDVVTIEFVSRDQMRRFAKRWRDVADAIRDSGREDPSFSFRRARIDLGDGVWHDTAGDVLAFARRPGSTVGLLPNTYLLRSRPRLPAALPWDRKADTLYFRGTSTGSQVYEENSRVLLCRLAKTLPRADCLISRVRQIDDGFARRLAEDRILGRRQPLSRLNRHRFLADVDGNTSSWDRYLFIGLFGGVPVRFETSWEECWHDLLIDGVNCVMADRQSLPVVLERLRSRPDEALAIARNATEVADSGLSRTAMRGRLRLALERFS
jgi:hypothetical protein